MIISPLSYEYIKAFNFYEKGFLPNGMIWTIESNKFIQAMNILENEFNRFRSEQLKSVKNA